LRVSDGERHLDAVTVLAQIHSRYTYFGKVPLGARVEHGLTVITFERLPLRRAPSILLRAIRDGELDRVKGVHVWQNVEEITVSAEPEEAIQADGELLGRAGAITISSAPDALRVVVPNPGSAHRDA
jgi:diacylglycerol kinase family enzyme